MLLLPGLMTFLALPKPQGRKHTNTITMPVLSKLISTYGKRLSGCSSFGLGLLFLAGWQQSGLLCFAEPSLGFLNPMLVSHCSASVFSSHPQHTARLVLLFSRHRCSGFSTVSFQVGCSGTDRRCKEMGTNSPAFCYWKVEH